MIFPGFVYRSPGVHRDPVSKKTYDYAPVENDRQVEEMLAKGWKATKGEALNPEAPEVPEPTPTRAEIEQMAKELGIKFDGRTSDRKLLKAIDDKLEEQNGLD
jgi:hypothetical protein